ncbi:hypothetical protein F383_24755 [Gossypium arboreum]|uniref:Uncharacterized protein n=1 Tax=Gossypium arboreum TaxID=29729 RepID=A0A0B0P6Z4_GOSAR|nr:hypothetical protein F383_24755 [Gossypium arboreum]
MPYTIYTSFKSTKKLIDSVTMLLMIPESKLASILYKT